MDNSVIPIVCDMTAATDTGTERIAEYRDLFVQALIGRERTPAGIRFRFRNEPEIARWVRDLAAREKACCAFFTFAVTSHGAELHWDATVVDDDTARAILDEFYALPDTVTEGVQTVHDRFTGSGLQFITQPDSRD